MRKYFLYIILIFFLSNNLIAKENIMILKLKTGDVEIELFEDIAPKHVERIKPHLSFEFQFANTVKRDSSDVNKQIPWLVYRCCFIKWTLWW